jgi:hypothetical protein
MIGYRLNLKICPPLLASARWRNLRNCLGQDKISLDVMPRHPHWDTSTPAASGKVSDVIARRLFQQAEFFRLFKGTRYGSDSAGGNLGYSR